MISNFFAINFQHLFEILHIGLKGNILHLFGPNWSASLLALMWMARDPSWIFHPVLSNDDIRKKILQPLWCRLKFIIW